jgi:gamma-glutamylcyclotransferase (GGCT)/AIG2-like uncharacterized protein YtfP
MLYFAYGSNLDPIQMRDRCPGSRPHSIARLDHYRLHFDGAAANWDDNAAANITPAYDGQVWGMLYEINENDLASLDEYESAPMNYQRFLVTVTRTTGDTCEAIVYLRHPQQQGSPSPSYINTILAGAVTHDLPVSYIHRLLESVSLRAVD